MLYWEPGECLRCIPVPTTCSLTCLLLQYIQQFASSPSVLKRQQLVWQRSCLWCNPERKKEKNSRRVIPEEHGGHVVGPFFLIHRSGNVSSGKLCSEESLCRDAPYHAEKLHVVEILVTAVQWTGAIRHVKEHAAETGITLKHSPSYQWVTCQNLLR